MRVVNCYLFSTGKSPLIFLIAQKHAIRTSKYLYLYPPSWWVFCGISFKRAFVRCYLAVECFGDISVWYLQFIEVFPRFGFYFWILFTYRVYWFGLAGRRWVLSWYFVGVEWIGIFHCGKAGYFYWKFWKMKWKMLSQRYFRFIDGE